MAVIIQPIASSFAWPNWLAWVQYPKFSKRTRTDDIPFLLGVVGAKDAVFIEVQGRRRRSRCGPESCFIMTRHWSDLIANKNNALEQIARASQKNGDFQLALAKVIIRGAEALRNDDPSIATCVKMSLTAGICLHSGERSLSSARRVDWLANLRSKCVRGYIRIHSCVENS